MISTEHANNRSRMRRIATAFIALALVGCDQQAKNDSITAPTVNVARVVTKQVQLWDEFSGRIEAVESVQIRPRVSGFIEKVNYSEGKNVKKGDVLFVIDARTWRADLARAKADLAGARSQLSLAHSEAERAKKLVAVKAISTELWEQRQAAVDQAQATLQRAEAAVTQAQLNLDWTQVRAPIDGMAGRARITTGNLVTGGNEASVLTTVVSQSQVYVYFDADETTFLRYARMTRNGESPADSNGQLPVRVGLAGETGYPHKGVVDFMDNELTRSTGSIAVRAILDNSDNQYRPGLFARVRLLGSTAFTALLIDDKAVLTDQDRKYVYVVDSEGKAQRRDIQPGRLAEGLRIVESGLSADDQVIVEGSHKVLVSGMTVDARPVARVDTPQVDKRTAQRN